MKKQEKWVMGSLCLVLISWGVEIFDKWSVLVAHLTPTNWLMIAIIHVAILLGLIGVYGNVPEGAPARWQVLLTAVIVIISWSMYLSLLGRFVSH
jgi:hypothetical protein